MSATVPEVILVGPKTRYRHFTRGPRDLYAPAEMLPDPPPQHVWSYCVSREHNNTVYFHNDASGRSLWVLPRLAADGTEAADDAEGVMRAIGSVESAAAARRRAASGSTEEAGHEAAAGRRAVVRQSIEKAVQQAQARRPAETTLATPPAEPAAGGNGEEKSTSAPVRERLALWRAKRAQQHQQLQQGGDEGSLPPHGRPSFSGPSTATARQRASSAAGKATPQGACHGAAPEQEEAVRRGVQPTQDAEKVEKSQPHQRQSPSLERDVYDEKRRLFLEAHEELQREKETALQQERLALERAARLREEQQREEEERTRLATERKRLEQQRLELQKRVLERQRELLAKVEEEAARREMAAKLDNFFENSSRLEHQAQAERQRVASFEEAIAESLLEAVAKSRTAPPKEERRIDLRLLEEGEADAEGDEDENNNSNRPAVLGRDGAPNGRTWREAEASPPQRRHRDQQHEPQRRRDRIAYSPSLVYVGDVMGGGRKPPSFLQRQGRGTFFYDAAQRYFFEGAWCDDKRDGSGALSLPHVALEGTWRRDQLEGRATFQTKRLKGTGEFQEGVLAGNAVVEIDCNSVFAGRVRKNAAIVDSGAITLASGDHVEWLRDETKDHRGARQRTATEASSSANGSGNCRIRFANGDTYAGQVENYQPHGTGAYRFAAEGQEYVGEFQHGRLQGRGTYSFSNGSVYTGQLYKGLFHGEGQYVQRDDYIYEGSWEYGTAHGKGKLIFANGDVWEGEFDHDRRLNGRYTASHLFQL
ncbi:MORN repeat-containing protein [Trypanosoma conorhini]|uniref:MORN repeat-containing protein n=1 Tax=Trypanosoma conorhini TaxID=83891 RepID=A0A422PZK3_9TRYP|nr:MORN repeat-containing protein [Trypanosoma conorhini]RNF23181.1 MORN repeat-containing protein [Trypanosoma conorhini]